MLITLCKCINSVLQLQMCKYMCKYMCMCMYECVCVRTCTHMYMYACVCVRTCTCVCMHTYTYAYTYIHIHTHVSVIDFFANGLTTTLQLQFACQQFLTVARQLLLYYHCIQQCLYVFVVLTTSLQLQEDCKIAQLYATCMNHMSIISL